MFQLRLTTLINIDNGNISTDRLNREGLHFNSPGSGKLAINFIKKSKTLKSFDRYPVVFIRYPVVFIRTLLITISSETVNGICSTEIVDSKSSDKSNPSKNYSTFNEIGLKTHRLIFAHFNINSFKKQI